MPKDLKQHLQEQQKQRQRIKAQTIKYTPSYAFIQILGHGTRGESRSVLLCTDHWNYLFNCGEGTQRLASEHHAKLTKIENIFITKPTWDNMGGLPGLALTIQETGVSTIHLHGPKDSIGIMESTKDFITLNELNIKSVDTSKIYNDQTMTVNYILIKKPKTVKTSDPEDSDFSDDQVNSNGKRPHSPKQKKSKTKESSVRKKNLTDELMVFICKLHEKAGTLNIEKCIELGVPKGPILGKLKAGEDVTLPDGRIIKSTDVVGKSDPGPVFIVLECPNEEWIDYIVENSIFLKHQQDTAENKENVASCIVHFTPELVLNNSKYKEWMRKFGSNTLHLILNEKNTGYSSESIYRMQHQLHLINPDIFPLIFNERHDFDQNSTHNISSLNINGTACQQNCINDQTIESNAHNVNLDPSFLKDEIHVRRCKTRDVVHLRPSKGLDTSNNIEIYPNHYIQEAIDIPGFSNSLTNLKTEINSKLKSLENIKEYPRLIMLGTGCSIPNKVRNTSGILFQLDEEKSILLDCGEATINQLIRFFGETKSDEILKSLKAIYVSHLHADHHLGLIGLLKQRKRVTKEPIFLLAPEQITTYLNFYHKKIDKIIDGYELIYNKSLLFNKTQSSKVEDLLNTLNVKEIMTTGVKHCPSAYAIAITLKDDKKICYSGDTEPCSYLEKLAINSFLLIHEATMEDGLEDEAKLKRHSTISQAINVGKNAKANFTLLTHFSQRYSKLPLLPNGEESGVDLSRVGVAYDFMQIALDRLTLLPLFYKSLEIMFCEFRAMLDERAVKRDCKKERLAKEAKEIS